MVEPGSDRGRGGKNLYCAVGNALGNDKLGLVNWKLLLQGFLQSIGGVLTAGGGLMLTNAGAAGAAPFTGGASAVAVAALDVAVVGWASMNIVNGVRNIEAALQDADEVEPAQVTIVRGVVETISGSPMSREGIQSVTFAYYLVDVAACSYTFTCGVWSTTTKAVKDVYVDTSLGLGVSYYEHKIKFVGDAATLTGPTVSATLDAWFLYSDMSDAVDLMTSDEYEQKRSLK